MVRSATPSPSPLQRKRLYIALGTLLGLASAIAHAQQSFEDVSAPVTGRAPVVTIDSIANTSRPGEPVTAGYALKVNAIVSDADFDAITETRYRWLRDGVEVANTETYTTQLEDIDGNLTVEVSADTDPAITEPATGSSQMSVSVAANARPTASVSITSPIFFVAWTSHTATAIPVYSDAEDDSEGASTKQWYLADDPTGMTNRTPIPGANGLQVGTRQEDLDKYLVFEITPVQQTGLPAAGLPSLAVSPTHLIGASSSPNHLPLQRNATREIPITFTGRKNEATFVRPEIVVLRDDASCVYDIELVDPLGNSYSLAPYKFSGQSQYVSWTDKIVNIVPQEKNGEWKYRVTDNDCGTGRMSNSKIFL